MQNKSSFTHSWKGTKGSDLECFSQWYGSSGIPFNCGVNGIQTAFTWMMYVYQNHDA